MAKRKRSGRARKGTGGIYRRGERYLAQIDLGHRKFGGKRDRRAATFDSREQAQQWLDKQRAFRHEPTDVTAL